MAPPHPQLWIPGLILHAGGQAGSHSLPDIGHPWGGAGRGGSPHEPEGVFADVHQAPQRLHGLVGRRRDVRELDWAIAHQRSLMTYIASVLITFASPVLITDLGT